jgi:hypothetical protein
MIHDELQNRLVCDVTPKTHLNASETLKHTGHYDSFKRFQHLPNTSPTPPQNTIIYRTWEAGEYAPKRFTQYYFRARLKPGNFAKGPPLVPLILRSQPAACELSAAQKSHVG